MPTGADLLVQRLRRHGVTQVFGYPGGQLTPVYDALARDGVVRHYLARHEQAAAFMADGYARATGRPGVCLAVCGPGVYNAATPLATAFTDSVPFLLLSGQVPGPYRGLRSGAYHENDQLHACATFTAHRAAVNEPAAIITAVDECFAAMTRRRPGPALLEVPVDVQRQPCTGLDLPPIPAAPAAAQPSPADVEALANLLATWKRPLLLVGGGVVSAGAGDLLARLAERLGAPVVHTFMGKSALSAEHPLHAGLPWSRATSDLSDMAPFLSPLFAEADGLLAVGCRFSQTATGSWVLKPPRALAQIDIDPAEIGRHYPVTVGMCADAALTLRALLDLLPAEKRPPWARLPQREPPRLEGMDLIGPLRRALPRDAIVAADVTRLGYLMLGAFPVYQPRSFLHPAGFVAMGYSLPAALGAKAAFPERTVVAVVGDGCFQMSGMELATAVQERLPVVVVLVNDGSLTLIKSIQERRYEGRFLGVELRNPDFALFGKAFGVPTWQVDSEDGFERALQDAIACREPALVEVRLS